MKKIWIVLLISFFGCATVRIPTYLQDKNAYTRRVHADFDHCQAAVDQSLQTLGWQVEEKTDPVVYEQDRINDLDEKQVLLLTMVRQTPLFFGTRYARLNIYIRSRKEISEVEVRYITVTATSIKTLTSYRNDAAVERFYTMVEKSLESM